MALKNRVKLSNKVRKIFSETEVGVLVEEFTSQVKLVAEDVSGLHDKVDRIEMDVNTIKEDIGVIKMDIEQIKYDLKKKVDRDEFAILERRVAILESRR